MTKKKLFMCILDVVVIIIAILGLCFKDELLAIKLDKIVEEDGYTIVGQESCDITLVIPKDELPDDIYTSEGHIFEEDEIIVYQTDTTTIYLEKVMLANEGDEQLYFMLNCSYDLPESGNIVLPYTVSEEGYSFDINLRNKALTDSVRKFPDALGMRGQGPEEQFAFYVSTDVCKAATGMMKIEAVANELSYARE